MTTLGLSAIPFRELRSNCLGIIDHTTRFDFTPSSIKPALKVFKTNLSKNSFFKDLQLKYRDLKKIDSSNLTAIFHCISTTIFLYERFLLHKQQNPAAPTTLTKILELLIELEEIHCSYTSTNKWSKDVRDSIICWLKGHIQVISDTIEAESQNHVYLLNRLKNHLKPSVFAKILEIKSINSNHLFLLQLLQKAKIVTHEKLIEKLDAFQNEINIYAQLSLSEKNRRVAKQAAQYGAVRQKAISDVFIRIKTEDPLCDQNLSKDKYLYVLGRVVIKMLDLAKQHGEEVETARKIAFANSFESATTLNFRDLDIVRLGITPQSIFPNDIIYEHSARSITLLRDNYNFFKDKVLFCKLGNYTFKVNLQRLSELIYLNFPVDSCSFCLQENLEKTNGFVNYDAAFNSEDGTFYLGLAINFISHPQVFYKTDFTIFNNPHEMQRIFAECQRRSWTYLKTLPKPEWITVTFEKLFKLAKRNAIKPSDFVLLEGKKTAIRDVPTLNRALKVPVKLISSSILNQDSQLCTNVLVRSTNPFLFTFSELKKHAEKNYKTRYGLVDELVKRLKSNWHVTAFQTLLYQFQDGQCSNMALSPVLDDNAERYASYLYSYNFSKDKLEFHQLLFDFYFGKIDGDTVITIHINGKKYSKSLSARPDLLHTLENLKWDLKLFDFDYVGGTNNLFNDVIHRDVPGTIIPFRSYILENKTLAEAHFPESAVEDILIQLGDSIDPEIYLKNSFPWCFIEKSKHQMLIDKILEIGSQPQFNHSFHLQEKALSTDTRLLSDFFASELSIYENYTEFWDLVDALLNEYPQKERISKRGWYTYTVTLEDFVKQPPQQGHLNTNEAILHIAKKLNMTRELLEELNPGLELMAPGYVLKTKPSLKGPSQASMLQRRTLAKSFFPKESPAQYKARRERIDAFLHYIENFNHLKFPINATPSEIIDKLTKILEDPITPFSSLQMQNYIERLNNLKSKPNQVDLDKFFIEFINAYHPTYLNIAAVMNPLLADVREMASYCTERDSEVENYSQTGALIGLYTTSIEKIIKRVLKIGTEPQKRFAEAFSIEFEKLKANSAIDRFFMGDF